MACPMGYTSLHQVAHNPDDILEGHPALRTSTAFRYITTRSDASSSLHHTDSKNENMPLALRHHNSTRKHHHHINNTLSKNDTSVPYLTREEFLSPNFHPRHITLIIQESLIIGGGAAAILLQIASPGAAAGVKNHSNFAHRVPDRLRTTMTYIYCMAFGTPGEKHAIIDAVNKVHRQVHGTLRGQPGGGSGEDGDVERKKKTTQFDALDPELQLWVAATLYYMGLNIYQQVFGRIEDDELHDAIYREYAIVAISLQVPAHMWPRDRRAFAEYFDKMVAGSEVTPDTREVARDLLCLTHAPVWMRMLMPSMRCVTAELLPKKVRSLPVRLYLWDMRRRLLRNQMSFEKA